MSSDDIARLKNRSRISPHAYGANPIRRTVTLQQTNIGVRERRRKTTRKVVACCVVLAVVCFLSLGVMGSMGRYYPYSAAYMNYTPLQVARVLFEHAYNAVAEATHWFPSHSKAWIQANVDGYWAIGCRAGVIGVTIICAVLLSLSGMLYQTTFKNPIAGPGLLGVSGGVSLSMMILVAVYGGAASGMLKERYILCYGIGALILVFVMLAGHRLSGKGRPFDVATMLLIGSILSQLLGFVVSYVTLFVMDDETYQIYYNVSQMLNVDISPLSWACLGVACVLSLVPVYVLRHKMDVLAVDDDEARLLGANSTVLRAVALVCGAIMILAAQVHTGMVGLVSLVVPFAARNWFGSEFTHQAVGCICISTVLLVVCRTVTDLIPFVGEGLAIGSVLSVVVMPIFLVMVSRHTRNWE